MQLESLPFSSAGCRTGNGEKVSTTQAEPGQAINSDVAYFPPFPVRHPALENGTLRSRTKLQNAEHKGAGVSQIPVRARGGARAQQRNPSPSQTR